MIFELPKSLEVCGRLYPIRYDYRVIIEICEMLGDSTLSMQEKAAAALYMFYPDFEYIPQEALQCAVEKCMWFIDCGQEHDARKSPRLVDWEQDFPYIAAPVNRVLGKEIRDIPYDMEANTGGLHWWSFMAAYQEIGNCVFAQIIRIRNLRSRGKALDKVDAEWYRQNRNLVDFRNEYTEAENDLLKQWGAG